MDLNKSKSKSEIHKRNIVPIGNNINSMMNYGIIM